MMKLALLLEIFLIFVGGCLQGSPVEPTISTAQAISGTGDLVLNEQDLEQMGLASSLNESELEQLGITGGTNCHTEEDYSNSVDATLGQYTVCAYSIPSLNDTQIIIELKKYANIESLNGSYQYDSSHYYSIEGLISENDFGDQSRFRVSNENDYGGEFNKPNVYYYHLWIAKDLYLMHITSSGKKEAEGFIAKIGRNMISKFG